MAFSLTKFIKGILIREENTLTPKEIEITPGGTAGTKTVITSSQTTNQTVTLPDVTDTLAGIDAAQTLTNKTIDADQNTISNIEDADIKVGAAIDRAKLASGTADVVPVNDASGVLIDSAVTVTELNALSGISGNIATDTNTLTLTNKSIDGAQNTLTNIYANDIVGVLATANGGTGDNNTLVNNRIIVSDTGAMREAAAITANRALISNANGIPTHSVVTDTELSTLSGITGSVVGTTNTQTLENKSLVDASTYIIDNADNTKRLQIQASAITTGTTRTLSVPDANTTIVGTDTSQTLSNKELVDSTTLIQDNADSSKKFKFEASSITTATTRTLTVPDADTTIVGTGTSQVLTNKDIDGGTASNSNRITVPKNTKANLDALTRKEATLVFASDEDKLYVDDGTVLTPVGSGQGGINYIDNPDAESSTTGWSTGSNNSNVTITIASPAQIDTTIPPLTPTFYTGQAITFSTTGSLPTGITAGTTYYVSTILGNGSFNISATPGGANINTSGSQSGTHTVRSQSAGLGGFLSASTLSLSRTTSSPLRGNGSFLITKAASNGQGEIVYSAFTIDSADTSKVLQISFDYEIASGTYSGGTSSTDSDLIAYIYDVTNNTIIQPVPYKIDGAVVGQKYTFRATFQASTSTSYRLVLQQTSTSTSANTVKYDNVVVGPQVSSYVVNVTDWQSYTPTFTGFGTVSSPSFLWRRVGGNLEIRGRVTAGTPTATEARMSLPAGLTSASTISTLEIAGDAARNQGASTTFFRNIVLIEPSVTYLTFGAQQHTINALTKQNATNIVTTGDVFGINASIPIQGWGAQTPSAAESEGRVVAATLRSSGAPGGTVAATLASSTAITHNTVDFDTHGAYNTSTGTYTVPMSGIYDISGIYRFNATFSSNQFSAIGLYVNGTNTREANEWTSNDSGALAHNQTVPFSFQVSLNAGDAVTLRAACQGTSPTLSNAPTVNSMQIKRIMGNSVPYAQETVAAKYNTSSTTITNSTFTIADFTTKVIDTHGAVTTGSSWKFTAPVAGTYQISASTTYTFAAWAASSVAFRVFKNGSSDTSLDVKNTAALSADVGNSGSTIIKLNAGDYIDLRLFQNSGSSRALNGAAVDNSISIVKVGN